MWQINRGKAALSLARLLLPELLAKIFELASDGWPRAPFVLSQVCSIWRAAAQSPRVWSRVFINCDLEDAAGRARFWLSKAQHAPLQIQVMGSRPALADLAQITSLLLSYASQWVTLALDLPLLRDTNYILSRCTVPVSKLRAITVKSEATFQQELDAGDSFIDLRDAFVDSPNLTRFKCSTNVVPPSLPFHITDLSMRFVDSPSHRPLSAASIVALLQNLNGLKELTIVMPSEFSHPFLISEDPSLLAHLPSLVSLSLEDAGGLSWILSHIDSPSLSRLHLRSPEVDDDPDHVQQPIGRCLLTMLKNSSKLQVLELHHIKIQTDSLQSCFAHLPELRGLRLHDMDIDDAIIQGLDEACPNLSRIDLRWCHLVHGAALVELARNRLARKQARLSSAETLQEISALHCSRIKKQDILELAKLATCRVVLEEEDDFCSKSNYLR